MEALENYTQARQRLARYKYDHQSILDEYETLLGAVAGAETALKETVRVYGQDVENAYYAVTITVKKRRWYDADKVIELAPYIAQIPGVMAVDRLRVEQLIRAKAVPEEVATQAYHEEFMMPALSIKEKAPDA